MNTYLLEIGLEEMPAQMILPAVEQLSKAIKKDLEQHNISEINLQCFSTPRRLAVLVSNLPEKQEDQDLTIKGPPAQMAKDPDGAWSKAALGFAKKNEVAVENLNIQEYDGREFLVAQKQVLGQSLQQVLQSCAANWITQLHFPKHMRWGAYKMKYIRPVRWIVSLWNQEELPIQIEMVSSGRQSQGHRFLASEAVVIDHAENYEAALESAHVVASYEKRRQQIVHQVKELEQQHGFQVKLDDDLLEEVTNLVELPTALCGSFDEAFLEVPKEVLITSMAKHQRYFPVLTTEGKLLPRFITVRNGNKEHLEIVAQGNEKVLSARLQDAQFFYREDQKEKLDAFHQRSASVVFFQERGSMFQRVQRIQRLTEHLAEQLNVESSIQADASRIAALSKFDLMTQMVYEFPDLQGIMGQYYATLQGESEAVVQGIREHYYPTHAQGELPSDLSASLVALADKLDMLIVAFSLGKIPTGSADPYALRRMAQGFMQIVLKQNQLVDLNAAIDYGIQSLSAQQDLSLNAAELKQALLDFIGQRQRFFMQESEIRYDVIDAVMEAGQLLPLQKLQLAQKLSEVLSTESFKLATEAVVRASNICEKQQQLIPQQLNESVLEAAEEIGLWQQAQRLSTSEIKLEDYITHLFELEPKITAFFDKVLVMDENPEKRNNRLFLCHTIAEWSKQYLNLNKIVFPK